MYAFSLPFYAAVEDERKTPKSAKSCLSGWGLPVITLQNSGDKGWTTDVA